MFKRLILLCLTLLSVLFLMGSLSVPAEEPPSYYTAHSVEELIYWIKTTEAEEADAWGSWYPFLSTARKFDRILTVQSASKEYTLEQITVQSNQDNMQYFFRKDNDRFLIYIELPEAENNKKPSLDEKITQLNNDLALEYAQLQYTKTSAAVNGTDIALYYCDGGEYLKKGSDQTELMAPTAYFEWMGHLVMIRGIGDLYGSRWDNAYLDLFKFDAIDVSQYKWNNLFTDVNETDWFYGDVEYVSIHDLMTGTGTAAFNPKVSLSRGMIVTILYRQAGSPDVNDLPNPFTDVPKNKWYTDAVKWAYANNIVNGTSPTTYAPDNAIKRQDLAAILYRCSNKILKCDLPAKKTYPGFADDALISDYAKPAVKAFYEAGIINGKSADAFDPKGTATRAEAAAMLHRFLQLV